jgi:hypothetical protein
VAVRPTGPDELPGLAELFEERFGHPWTEAEWAWKYRNPLGGAAEPGGSEAARSWVAVKEGAGARVVAHAGALRFPARLGAGGSTGSTRGGIWQLTDWMGSVAAGGLRPPLVTLGRALLADLPGPGDAPWIFGFPSERHLRLGRRTFGYRPLPEVKPLAGELAEAAEAAVAGGTGARGQGTSDGAIREVTDHCGDWAEAAWEACGVAGVRRSAAFLNWRYHARPGRYDRVYRLAPAVSLAPADEGADGLAVFAFVAALGRGAELWLPGPPERAAERWAPALGAVALDLAAAGLTRWQLWPPPPGSGLEPLLRAFGLRPGGDPVIMGCRGRGGTIDGPSPADPNFHYSMGDYDSV